MICINIGWYFARVFRYFDRVSFHSLAFAFRRFGQSIWPFTWVLGRGSCMCLFCSVFCSSGREREWRGLAGGRGVAGSRSSFLVLPEYFLWVGSAYSRWANVVRRLNRRASDGQRVRTRPSRVCGRYVRGRNDRLRRGDQADVSHAHRSIRRSVNGHSSRRDT